MDALLRRRIMMMAGAEPGPEPPSPTPTPNYLIYGNPTIEGNICTPDTSANGFIYTPSKFNPASKKSWTIQTKIRIKSALAWRTILGSVDPSDGSMVRSIVAQTNQNDGNKQVSFYASSNGSSWNLLNNKCTISIPLSSWYVFQVVCTYANNTYSYKMGFPELSSWSSSVSNATIPTFDKYIGFGINKIDADFDLSETKIWIDSSLWWEAITNLNNS